MRLFSAIDTSASGLTAERLRMEVIANNLANAEATRTPEGGPYRRQVAVFAPRLGASAFARFLGRLIGGRSAAGEGVRVVGIVPDPTPFKVKYDPGHPDANPQGYVELPNVDVVKEMVDLIAASRAYEANITALEAGKQMAQRSLEIGRS
ncbi:MAG: flagellar basal body rod protein FlgC [Acetobacteraceae bacterium]|nr:flagellar basal body rod protein FlgC [Acetobacteraceae bacterium]